MGFNIIGVSRNEDKKDLSKKLGFKHYFFIDKDNFAHEIKD